MYEAILGILIGLGLAAACGFRVFVPLLVLSLGARSGLVGLSSGLSWIGSDAALVAFATASALEVAGYWIPWLDHALDSVASPAAVVAGSLAAASQMGDITIGLAGSSGGDVLKWAAAIIAGGGVAGVVQGASVATRAVSTVSTAGVANPIVSTVESVASAVLSVLAIVAPLVAGVALLTILVVVVRWVLRRRRRRVRLAVERSAESANTAAI